MANYDNPTNNKSHVFESSKEIHITKNIVKFGSSIYQLKNITGFKYGRVRRWKFPSWIVSRLLYFGVFGLVLGLSLIGLLEQYEGLLNNSSEDFDFMIDTGALLTLTGGCMVILAIFIVLVYLFQFRPLALILYANSGHERIFVSHNRPFLMNVIKVIYDFMDNDTEKALHIDMSNRSIKVDGSFYGQAVVGDRNVVRNTTTSNRRSNRRK